MSEGKLCGFLAGIVLGSIFLCPNLYADKNSRLIGKVPYSTVDSVYRHLVNEHNMPRNDYFILVYGRAQKEYIFKKDRKNNFEILKEYNISTGRNGFGNKTKSGKTSTGSFRIHKKYGTDAPIGTIFEYLINTKRIAEIERSEKKTKKRLLLTRVITLEGLDLINKNMLERGIYIHGTNEEGLIGEPASDGCINMINRDIIDFYDFIKLRDFGQIVE